MRSSEVKLVKFDFGKVICGLWLFNSSETCRRQGRQVEREIAEIQER